MATVWRYLFENLEWRLLMPFRGGKLSSEEAKLYESASIVALAGAADILRTADFTNSSDADVIWRNWEDLRFSFRAGTQYDEILNHLHGVYEELSASTVAWLLRQGIKIDTAPDVRRRVLQTTRERLSQLEAQRPMADLIPRLLDDDESIGSKLWGEWMQEQMPEREVVYVESLRTGLLRLLILSLISSGPLDPEQAQQSMRFVQEEEVRGLGDEVMRAFESSDIQLTSASVDSVLDYFRTMKRLASRAHAIETFSHPISDEVLDSIRTSAIRGWSDTRELQAVLEAAGCSISDARSTVSVWSPKVPRTFLIEDADSGRQEKWIGTEAGRVVARSEMSRAIEHWTEHAEPLRPESFIEALLPQLGDRAPLLLLLPDDWRTQMAARGNRALSDAEVQVIPTPAVPDRTALLLWAAEESWRLGSPESISLSHEELELSADDEDAYVVLRFRYGRPEAAGPVQVIRLHTDQVASSEGDSS